MDEIIEIGCAFLIVVIICAMLIFGIVWVTNESTFPSIQAKIEQLRKDAAGVDPQQAEDVIGQVTEWNQAILSNQANNKIFIIGLITPDGWDNITTIRVPSK